VKEEEEEEEGEEKLQKQSIWKYYIEYDTKEPVIIDTFYEVKNL